MNKFQRIMSAASTVIVRINDVVTQEQYDAFDTNRYYVIVENLNKLADRYDLTISLHNSCVSVSGPNGLYYGGPNYESTLTNMMSAVGFLNEVFPNNRITHFDATLE